jgi:hypothetical protein
VIKPERHWRFEAGQTLLHRAPRWRL